MEAQGAMSTAAERPLRTLTTTTQSHFQKMNGSTEAYQRTTED